MQNFPPCKKSWNRLICENFSPQKLPWKSYPQLICQKSRNEEFHAAQFSSHLVSVSMHRKCLSFRRRLWQVLMMGDYTASNKCPARERSGCIRLTVTIDYNHMRVYAWKESLDTMEKQE